MASFNFSRNNYKPITVGIHLVVWLFFIQIFFSLEGLYYSLYEIFFENEAVVFDEAFIVIPSVLSLFYLNLLFWIPKFANRKYWLKYTFIAISFVALISVLGILSYKLSLELGYDYNVRIDEFIEIIFTTNIFVFVVSFAIGITKEMLQRTDEMMNLKQEQKVMELHYLQSQIQPHFLFNTLNTLYSLAVSEEADKTTDGILGLSEMMRYGLTQDETNLVSVEDEVSFIESYIEFQRIKLGDRYPVVLNQEIIESKKKLMAMCLIPLVENAFKYGVSQQNKTPIIFNLCIDKEKMTFNSENRIHKGQETQSHHMGLENLRQRLNLMYRTDYILEIDSNEKKFKVNLVVPLK